MNLAVGFNPLVSTQIMFNRIPPAGAGGSFNPSLQYLHKLCSTESRRREPVDRSIPAYNIYTNYVQPNPTGGSRWIVQSQPTRTGKIPQNPTTGRWWIVQVQPARSTTENRGRD